MNTAHVSPRAANQKYSNEEKFSATSANSGAATIRMATPNSPPTAEQTRLTPRFLSSSPFRAMA